MTTGARWARETEQKRPGRTGRSGRVCQCSAACCRLSAAGQPSSVRSPAACRRQVRPAQVRAWAAGTRFSSITAAAMCALLGTLLTAGDSHVLGRRRPSPATLPARPRTSATPATPATPAHLARRPADRQDRRPRHPRPPGACGSTAWPATRRRQIQRAYDLPALYARGLDGRGRTIVIVDSFGSPTIRHDLRVFDTAFGLPGPPSLRVLQPVGHVPPYNAKNPDMVDAAGETTTDVEAAHAIAPRGPASCWSRRPPPRP